MILHEQSPPQTLIDHHQQKYGDVMVRLCSSALTT
jgi:hypothetical protein